MTIHEIEDILLEYDNDDYIEFRHNIIQLINNIKKDKDMCDVDYLLDYYEL
jgi:hypothetical protein